MQIQPLNTYQNSKPNFKSRIPVYHWIAETGGSYAPEIDINVIEKLQKKLGNLFNRVVQKNKPEMKKISDKAVEYLKKFDLYYSFFMRYISTYGKKLSPTRSFYNKNGGWKYNQEFEPMSYLITGVDVQEFNEKFAKAIGQMKSQEPRIENKNTSADMKMVMHNFYRGGLEYVKDPKKQIRTPEGVPLGLHTKYEIVRNSEGEIVDYKFIDMKFLPEFGKDNPFEKLRRK